MDTNVHENMTWKRDWAYTKAYQDNLDSNMDEGTENAPCINIILTVYLISIIHANHAPLAMPPSSSKVYPPKQKIQNRHSYY